MSTPPLPPPEHPRNLKELARVLGFSAPALSQWRTKFPGEAPQGFEVAEWQKFIASHNLGIVGNRVSKGREELLRLKLTTEVRLNEIKIAKEERKLVPAGDVESFLTYSSARLKAGLYRMIAELAPKVAGLEAVEVRQLMTEHADVLCVAMQSLVEEWRREQEEAAEAAAAAAGGANTGEGESREARG